MPALIAPEDIIIGSLRNFRRHIRSYAEFAMWFALIVVASWAFDITSQSLIADKTARLFAYLIFAAPIGLASLMLTVAMIDFTFDALRGRTATVRDSLYEGWHRLLTVFWVTTIAALATGGGFLLFVIPGFIFYFWFRFAVYASVVDGQRGTEALAMSRRAVRGRFWPVVGRTALSWLVLILLAYLAERIIFLVIGAAVGDPGIFFNPSTELISSSSVLSLLRLTVPRIINAMSLPIFIAADLILWQDLKR